MRSKPVFLLVILLVLFVAGQILAADGTGTVAQIGKDNLASAFQDLQSEVIILQLGDSNTAYSDQIGLDQLAAIAQVGDDHKIQVWQYGQRDIIFSLQFGYSNQADLSQIKDLTYANNSANDGYIYQSGLNNSINLLQIQDNNTASLYQMDSNNEIIAIQDHWFVTENRNSLLAAQYGRTNLLHSIQIGTGQLASQFQLGNDNTALLNQTGSLNKAFLSQMGDYNKGVIKQTQMTIGLLGYKGELIL